MGIFRNVKLKLFLLEVENARAIIIMCRPSRVNLGDRPQRKALVSCLFAKG
jgi:hypothetical protein